MLSFVITSLWVLWCFVYASLFVARTQYGGRTPQCLWLFIADACMMSTVQPLNNLLYFCARPLPLPSPLFTSPIHLPAHQLTFHPAPTVDAVTFLDSKARGTLYYFTADYCRTTRGRPEVCLCERYALQGGSVRRCDDFRRFRGTPNKFPSSTPPGFIILPNRQTNPITAKLHNVTIKPTLPDLKKTSFIPIAVQNYHPTQLTWLTVLVILPLIHRIQLYQSCTL